MTRRILNLAAILCFLLFLVIIAAWIRSEFVCEQYVWSDGSTRPNFGPYRMGQRWVLTLGAGRFSVTDDTGWYYPKQRRYIRLDGVRPDLAPFGMAAFTKPARSISVPGFQYAAVTGTPPLSSVAGRAPILLCRVWTIHLSIAAVLILILPAARGIAIYRARSRRKIGLCPICSYDLRAHSPGDKCPECGNPIPRPGVQSSSP